MEGKRRISPVQQDDVRFLRGPQARLSELAFLWKVGLDFVRGFRRLHFSGPCVTVFGSARFGEGHRYYALARDMGRKIAQMGLTCMTGGGPGIMEAANRGAYEAGGRSLGCNIILPREQEPNAYLHKWVSIHYFFVRKVLLSKYSCAFVVMPGGLGTMDEMFEALTLIQTGKMFQFPVVLMGSDYYTELREHIEFMAKEKTIDPRDLELFLVTDSVEEASAHIRKLTTGMYEPAGFRKIKPVRALGEREA